MSPARRIRPARRITVVALTILVLVVVAVMGVMLVDEYAPEYRNSTADSFAGSILGLLDGKHIQQALSIPEQIDEFTGPAILSGSSVRNMDYVNTGDTAVLEGSHICVRNWVQNPQYPLTKVAVFTIPGQHLKVYFTRWVTKAPKASFRCP